MAQVKFFNHCLPQVLLDQFLSFVPSIHTYFLVHIRAIFLYPMKISENQTFFWCLLGGIERTCGLKCINEVALKHFFKTCLERVSQIENVSKN